MPVQIRGQSQPPSVERIVCHCAGVPDRQNGDSIQAGAAADLHDVMQLSGAGQACTGCHYRIRRMLAGQTPECGPFAGCEPITGTASCVCSAV